MVRVSIGGTEFVSDQVIESSIVLMTLRALPSDGQDCCSLHDARPVEVFSSLLGLDDYSLDLIKVDLIGMAVVEQSTKLKTKTVVSY